MGSRGSGVRQLRRRAGRGQHVCPRAARRADQALPWERGGGVARAEDGVQAAQRGAQRARACSRVVAQFGLGKSFSHAAGCHPGTQAQPRVEVRIFARHTERRRACAACGVGRGRLQRHRWGWKRTLFVRASSWPQHGSRSFPTLPSEPAAHVDASGRYARASCQTSAGWHMAVGGAWS